MLVRILYLNVVSKLIFLTIVLLNDLTQKNKISKSIIQDSVELEWLKLIYQSVSLVIFQVICGLITVMKMLMYIFSIHFLFYFIQSMHMWIEQKKNNCITCAFFHAHNEHIPTRREYLKCNDILKQPPPPPPPHLMPAVRYKRVFDKAAVRMN